MHNCLPSLLPKGRFKVLSVVLRKVVSRDGLAAILVYPLEDLVAGGVPEARKEGNKFAAERNGGLILEDDAAEFAGAGDLQ